MTQVNRSLFKTKTSSQELIAEDKKLENLIDNKDYAGFLKIEPGLNKFRIYPPHPREDGKKAHWIAARQIYWLPFIVDDKDKDGNVKKDKSGKALKIEKNKPIFDARVHSSVGIDIVDRYIKILEASLIEQYGKDSKEHKEGMEKINGSWTKKVQSIIGKPGWVVYADKIIGEQKTFGRVEFPKAVKYRINGLITTEQSNEPVSSEGVENPFTDPDNGRLIQITYNDKAERPQDYYTTEIDSSFDKVTKMVNLAPLTDAEIENFLKFPSLNDQYIDVYTKRDFQLALEGLKNFDEREEFDIFSNEEFLKEAERLIHLYPDPKEDDTTDQNNDTTTSDDSKDQFEEMSRDDMKKFARINSTGIVVNSKLSDDDLREELRNWVINQENDGEDNTQDSKDETSDENNGSGDADSDVDQKDEPDEPKIDFTKRSSVKDKMSKMKSKK